MTRPRVTPERARPTTSTTTTTSIESTPSPARETRDGAAEEGLDLDDDSSPLVGRMARVTLSDATNAIVDEERGGGGRGKPLGSGFVVKKRCARDRGGRERGLLIETDVTRFVSSARLETDERRTDERLLRRFHSPTDSAMSPASKFVARKAHHHAATSIIDKLRAAPRPGAENTPPPPPPRLAASRFRPLDR